MNEQECSFELERAHRRIGLLCRDVDALTHLSGRVRTIKKETNRSLLTQTHRRKNLKAPCSKNRTNIFGGAVGSYLILSMRPRETSLLWSKILWLNVAPMTLWPFIERMKFAVRTKPYFWSGLCFWLRLLLHSRDGCRDFRDAFFVLSTAHVGDIRYQMRCRNYHHPGPQKSAWFNH